MAGKHIVILGAGAVGLTLAAFLRTQGHRITLLTRSGKAALPVELIDEIGKRKLKLEAADLEVRASSDPPCVADHVIVCTRAEQLAGALAAIRAVDPAVPITNAAATLEDVSALARTLGLTNPLLMMGVGFAAWPLDDGRYRVFALSPPGPAVAPLTGAGRRAARELVGLLASAGFPAQAPPPQLFRWVFPTVLALEVPFMLAYRQAGWELDELARRPGLLRSCGAAMQEVARVARGGPVARVASAIPASLYTRWCARRVRTATPGFRDVWRHHGPKVSEQLDLLARQVFEHAGTKPMAALRSLSSARF